MKSPKQAMPMCGKGAASSIPSEGSVSIRLKWYTHQTWWVYHIVQKELLHRLCWRGLRPRATGVRAISCRLCFLLIHSTKRVIQDLKRMWIMCTLVELIEVPHRVESLINKFMKKKYLHYQVTLNKHLYQRGQQILLQGHPGCTVHFEADYCRSLEAEDSNCTVLRQ